MASRYESRRISWFIALFVIIMVLHICGTIAEIPFGFEARLVTSTGLTEDVRGFYPLVFLAHLLTFGLLGPLFVRAIRRGEWENGRWKAILRTDSWILFVLTLVCVIMANSDWSPNREVVEEWGYHTDESFTEYGAVHFGGWSTLPWLLTPVFWWVWLLAFYVLPYRKRKERGEGREEE